MKTKNIEFLKCGLICLIAVGAIVSGCKKDEDETQGTNDVWMQNNIFNPSTITITKNTTITWTNKDNTNHSVTSNSGAFDSGTLGNGGTFSFQFTDTGTFNYHCNFHLMMYAKVVVN